MDNPLKRVQREAFGFTNFENFRIIAPLYGGKPNFRVLELDRGDVSGQGTTKWLPTRDFLRAEDGIRTRDPHLGKVFEFVHGVMTSALNWPPVYGKSTESAQIEPCCRAVY